jgi:hypothetical protein
MRSRAMRPTRTASAPLFFLQAFPSIWRNTFVFSGSTPATICGACRGQRPRNVKPRASRAAQVRRAGYEASQQP